MCKEITCIKNEIVKIVIKYTKMYKGTGPLYVKVFIKEDIVKIEVKGVLSAAGDFFLKQNDVKEIERIWESVKKYILHTAIEEISKVIGKKCSLISDILYADHNIRTFTLKIT